MYRPPTNTAQQVKLLTHNSKQSSHAHDSGERNGGDCNMRAHLQALGQANAARARDSQSTVIDKPETCLMQDVATEAGLLYLSNGAVQGHSLDSSKSDLLQVSCSSKDETTLQQTNFCNCIRHLHKVCCTWCDRIDCKLGAHKPQQKSFHLTNTKTPCTCTMHLVGVLKRRQYALQTLSQDSQQ